MSIDLHCHSNHSDGELSPLDLVELALKNKATMLSITDHDTVSAYEDLPKLASLDVIPGVEFSSIWKNINVHVVGLGIDPFDKGLLSACEDQSVRRLERAEVIARRLFVRKLVPSVDTTIERVYEIAGGRSIGRPHFAEYLVEIGVCDDTGSAFRSYLSAGKIGDVKDQWPNMGEVIAWICQAGGIPVLAHPAKYKMTRTKLIALVSDFKRLGGRSIEVCSGYQTSEMTKSMSRLSEEFDLSASCGSDFHSLDRPWSQVGKVPALPSRCRPVWEDWT